MASEIRALLSAAQSAEVKGDAVEAARLLRQAAAFYRDRQLVTRAMQMLRHARRLEGHEDPGPPLDGFAPRELAARPDDYEGPTGEVDWSNDDDDEEVFGFSEPGAPAFTGHARELTVADPALNAWCSFCCRPGSEVGTLTAGPTNAFICAGCTERAGGLLGRRLAVRPGPPVEGASLLRAQQLELKRFVRRAPRLALIIGPEGTGKSELLRAMKPARAFDGPVTDDSINTGVIAVRGEPPAPALVLEGEHGPEPVYDTETLFAAVKGQVSKTVLSRVDAVLVLPALDSAALGELATLLLARRGVTLPVATIAQLVSLAEKSGRSAHELVALVARIPSGTYQRS